MPFTPFHFGPGAVAKSLAPRWFSIRAFALSQFVIDCETAWNMARGSERLHTFFHSYLGASVAMLATGVLLVVYNRVAPHLPTDWLEETGGGFRLLPSSVAIILGGWSHVFLDSLMHEDMKPWAPISDTNNMLNLVSVEALHMACFRSFAVAGLFFGCRWVYRKARGSQRDN